MLVTENYAFSIIMLKKHAPTWSPLQKRVQLILDLEISSIIFFKIQHLQDFVYAYPKKDLYKEQAIGPDVMYKIICETHYTVYQLYYILQHL